MPLQQIPRGQSSTLSIGGSFDIGGLAGPEWTVDASSSGSCIGSADRNNPQGYALDNEDHPTALTVPANACLGEVFMYGTSRNRVGTAQEIADFVQNQYGGDEAAFKADWGDEPFYGGAYTYGVRFEVVEAPSTYTRWRCTDNVCESYEATTPDENYATQQDCEAVCNPVEPPPSVGPGPGVPAC